MVSRKIYLAVPYTHDNPEVRQARFNAATVMAADLINQGHLVYSPITQTHHMTGLPITWDFWESMCREFVTWADELHILQLPGWTESEGIAEEIKLATKQGMPIYYI